MQNPVTKRLVFYCPGYDPEADTRYRRLLAIGLGHLRRRFGIDRTIGPVEHDDRVPSLRWGVTASGKTWRTETVYEVLRWDDLVKRDLSRSWFERTPILLTCMFVALRERYIAKLFRVDWHFACMVVYPWVCLLAVVIGAAAVGCLAAFLIGLAAPLPPWVIAVAALVVALASLAAVHPLLKGAFVYGMLDDWIFNWQHGTEQRADIEARLDRFGERIVEAVRLTDAQEVLIVGHSSGSILAVEVAARVLARNPRIGTNGPALALLTIGAELPIVGFMPKAVGPRQAITDLTSSRSLLWVEYQAPQDVLNAFRFEPVRDLGLDLGGKPQTNPHIRSPRFGETMLPENYRKMKWKFLRIHFQFLMPVDIPGEYDYPMIACGPVALADRIADPAMAVRAGYG